MVNQDIINAYAKLLVEYSLSIESGDKLLIKSTTLALPLIKAVYRLALQKGAIVETDIDFEGMFLFQRDELKCQPCCKN